MLVLNFYKQTLGDFWIQGRSSKALLSSSYESETTRVTGSVKNPSSPVTQTTNEAEQCCSELFSSYPLHPVFHYEVAQSREYTLIRLLSVHLCFAQLRETSREKKDWKETEKRRAAHKCMYLMSDNVPVTWSQLFLFMIMVLFFSHYWLWEGHRRTKCKIIHEGTWVKMCLCVL